MQALHLKVSVKLRPDRGVTGLFIVSYDLQLYSNLSLISVKTITVRNHANL